MNENLDEPSFLTDEEIENLERKIQEREDEIQENN